MCIRDSGDLVAWLCDWWDLLGNWTPSGYLTNAAALAIEYCDNFHAQEFDECEEWTKSPAKSHISRGAYIIALKTHLTAKKRNLSLSLNVYLLTHLLI